MHVNDEVDASNFQNQPEVTQINRLMSNRLMEYREGGLLELPFFFDRFRGNIIALASATVVFIRPHSQHVGGETTSGRLLVLGKCNTINFK
jgi:hypothetical protein